MSQVVEMSPASMIYIPSFVKIGSSMYTFNKVIS
jgi:hypothetical protein